MKARLIAGLLILATPAIASAQAPSCEDQLALSNQLLQDFNQEKGRLQVEAASLKVQVGRIQQEVKALKDAIPKKETTKK